MIDRYRDRGIGSPATHLEPRDNEAVSAGHEAVSNNRETVSPPQPQTLGDRIMDDGRSRGRLIEITQKNARRFC